MPRRSYNEDDDDESTFTEDYRTVLKEKNMSASNSIRLASHNKTRVAYFHDEGVGNYHYGVSVVSLTIILHQICRKLNENAC